MGRMDKDKRIEERNKRAIEDYISGKVGIKGEHPEEIMVAIDTFFHVGKMLMDNPELNTVPPEYVENLLKALAKYPRYNELTLDLIRIINRGGE